MQLLHTIINTLFPSQQYVNEKSRREVDKRKSETPIFSEEVHQQKNELTKDKLELRQTNKFVQSEGQRIVRDTAYFIAEAVKVQPS